MTDQSVRNMTALDVTAADPGTLPEAPLAMPAQRLEPDASWLREALAAPLRMFQIRSREV